MTLYKTRGLTVQTTPQSVEAIGHQLAGLPQVRYCAAIAGDFQLLVDVTLPNQRALYNFLSNPAWNAGATRIRSAVVVRARKRGGRLFDIS